MDDMNVVLLGENAKLGKLGFNGQYLAFLLLGGFAGIKEEFLRGHNANYSM